MVYHAARQHLRFAESLVKLRVKLAAKENEIKEHIMRAGDRVSLSFAPWPVKSVLLEVRSVLLCTRS